MNHWTDSKSKSYCLKNNNFVYFCPPLDGVENAQYFKNFLSKVKKFNFHQLLLIDGTEIVYDLKFLGALKFKLVAPMPEQLKTTTMHFYESPRKPY